MKNKKLNKVINLLLQAKNELDLQALLQDLFTEAELEDLVDRIDIVAELLKGKSQRQVSSDLNVSISKVTRGSRAIKYGKGSFRKLLSE